MQTPTDITTTVFQPIMARAGRLPYVAAVLTLAAAIVGIALSTQLTNAYTLTIPPLIGIGALIGVASLRADLSEPVRLPTLNTRVLLSVWLLSMAIVIGTAFRYGERLWITHAAQIVMYGVSALVVFSGQSRRGIVFTIPTALVHRISIYYSSATLIGLDALFHVRTAEAIADAGSLAPLIDYKYWYAPFTHVLLAVSDLVTGVAPRDAALVATLAAVFIPLLGCYVAGARLFSPHTAAVATFLFALGDWATAWAVQPTPTTLGICLYALIIAIAIRWIRTDDNRLFGMLVAFLLAQIATHQISAFISILTLGGLLVGRSIWPSAQPRSARAQAFRVLPLLGVLLVWDWMSTQRRGPHSEFPPFLVEMIGLFVQQIQTRGSRPTTPPNIDVAIAGADSMTPLQTLGIALLFGMGVVGGIRLLREDGDRPIAVALGVVVAILSLFTFVAPIVGINFFLPRRWFVFLYFILGLLAAVGVLATGQTIASVAPDREQTAVFTVVLLFVLTPFSGVMLLAYPGAVDDPVLDDAPGAHRLGSTPTEAALYQFTASHSGHATVAADHVARQQVERNFGREARYYRARQSSPQTMVYEGDVIFVGRQYTDTKHASWEVRTNRWLRVFGPIPYDESRSSKVYTAGADHLWLKHDSA